MPMFSRPKGITQRRPRNPPPQTRCGREQLATADSSALEPARAKEAMNSCFTNMLLGAVLLAGCQHRPPGPPKESGAFRESALIEITSLDPTIHLDIRYATTNNFMHRSMYAQAKAFLQQPAASALARAHRSLRAKGYGIVVFDAYRPWSVTRIFWESASPAERKIEFVANPKKGSRHNRGCAVDISLFELSSGAEVKMPSAYDEFTERAFPTYARGTPESTALRDLLREAMEAEGFTVYKTEWWHFDFKDWPQYRILDIPFDRIGR